MTSVAPYSVVKKKGNGFCSRGFCSVVPYSVVKEKRAMTSYYQGIAKRAGKDFRDGAVVPLE